MRSPCANNDATVGGIADEFAQSVFELIDALLHQPHILLAIVKLLRIPSGEKEVSLFGGIDHSTIAPIRPLLAVNSTEKIDAVSANWVRQPRWRFVGVLVPQCAAKCAKIRRRVIASEKPKQLANYILKRLFSRSKGREAVTKVVLKLMSN